MTRGKRALITWVAIADFFTALALMSLALYASHRHRTLGTEHWITVDREVKELSRLLSDQLRKNGVPVEPPNENLAIVLPEIMLFESGKFEIIDGARLEAVATALKNVRVAWKKNFILVIQGYTDARPVKPNRDYGDNRELSLLRAHAVEGKLAFYGVRSPEFQVVAQGLGPADPVVANCIVPVPKGEDCGDLENYVERDKLAKNRRIELRFGVFSANGK